MHKNSKSNLVASLNVNRIYLCLVATLILMPIIILLSGTTEGMTGVTNFFGPGNMVPVIKTSVLYIMAGIGFTFVMIGGNFDLSIGSVINVGACLSIGFFNMFFKMMGSESILLPWILAITLACAAGCACGALNGWLVAYGKVHSFIVTIGTQTALAGFVYTYCSGNTLSAKDSTLTDMLEIPFRKIGATEFMKASYLDLFTARFVIMILVLAAFAVLLSKSRWGRDFLMTGSNADAAWQAGINTQRKILMSFVISGFTASLAGAMFAISMNAAVPNFGERGISPLMLTMAATIIGGTVMTGGSGSVIKTGVAVVTLEIVFSVLVIMGMGFDAQVLAAGVLLASIVFFEAFSLYRQALRKGIRPALLEEAAQIKKAAHGAK